MREAFALVRASWLTAASYKISLLVSLASLVATVVPVYFVANAIEPVIADSIRSQGDHYFAFLLVGMVTFSFLSTAVNALPGAISSGVGSGTLEALFSTPAPLPALLAGMTGYGFVWTAVRSAAILAAGWLFGIDFAWGQALIAAGILLLIILTYLPFGLFAAAMVLAFRTTGPLPKAVLVLSGLLGGVYYPTQVIPSWLQELAEVIPLTYGLRALRQTLLEGLPLRAVAPDVATLLFSSVVLLALGGWSFAWALQYAKRSGTLSQY